jgi:MinD superfamily P-loop ATPase
MIRFIKDQSLKYELLGLTMHVDRENAHIELKKYCKNNQSEILHTIPELKDPIEAWLKPNPFDRTKEHWDFVRFAMDKTLIFEDQLESALAALMAG